MNKLKKGCSFNGPVISEAGGDGSSVEGKSGVRQDGCIPGQARVPGRAAECGDLASHRQGSRASHGEGRSIQGGNTTRSVGHLGKQAQHQGMGLSVFIGVGHFIG